MQALPIFYQAENLGRIERASFPVNVTLADVLVEICGRHGCDITALLFLEDADEPAELTVRLGDLADSKGLKVHMHRCRHIGVSVTFNGKTQEHRFAPGTTVARVKHWATQQAFPMSPEQAAEHVLQLVGGTERPSPGTHLGSLTVHPHCQVRFDLVPNERVNGAPGLSE